MNNDNNNYNVIFKAISLISQRHLNFNIIIIYLNLNKTRFENNNIIYKSLSNIIKKQFKLF